MYRDRKGSTIYVVHPSYPVSAIPNDGILVACHKIKGRTHKMDMNIEIDLAREPHVNLARQMGYDLSLPDFDEDMRFANLVLKYILENPGDKKICILVDSDEVKKLLEFQGIDIRAGMFE